MFYSTSIFIDILLGFLVYLLHTHPFPLLDPFMFLLFEAPTLMAGTAEAVVTVPWSLWVRGGAQNRIPSGIMMSGAEMSDTETLVF